LQLDVGPRYVAAVPPSREVCTVKKLVVGSAPALAVVASASTLEAAGPEPLSACQWDMREIDAGAPSRALATGRGVLV
jgi:hypothetical protein